MNINYSFPIGNTSVKIIKIIINAQMKNQRYRQFWKITLYISSLPTRQSKINLEIPTIEQIVDKPI